MAKKLIAMLGGASVAALLGGAAAQAQALAGVTFTGEAGYSQVMLDDADVDLGVITLRGGAQLNEYFGVEAEAHFGVNDDQVDVGGTTADVEVNTAFGLFAVGSLPVAEGVQLFGRVGYFTAEVEASAGGASADDSEDGVAFGAGVKWYPQDGAWGVRGEYTRVEFDDDSADIIGISGVYRFGAGGY